MPIGMHTHVESKLFKHTHVYGVFLFTHTEVCCHAVSFHAVQGHLLFICTLIDHLAQKKFALISSHLTAADFELVTYL